MIEREFVRQKKKEFQIQQFISDILKNVGHSFTEVQRTPLGEKVIVHTSRPGLVVGRKGQNISRLTDVLKTRFNLENPQVEISEVSSPELDANIVAERIASSLERFGSNRFKGIMHKTMEDVLGAGAVGVEIRLSGKLPSSRAKSWRVYGGYLKKCGDSAFMNVRRSCTAAKLKAGVIGIQVRILPPGVVMPDAVGLKDLHDSDSSASVGGVVAPVVAAVAGVVASDSASPEPAVVESVPKEKKVRKSRKKSEGVEK
ncbi:30S ribosomal protein S3 [Candidatus Woesearchaeota archaeon]|nr:30S ribosomal protein S3 [Candidatus Woesearchaeota archaeon]